MGDSSGAHAETPSTDSVDSLICAVAAAPPRALPTSGAFSSPFAAGVEVGRYRLVRSLGRGGMGSVWEAMHSVTGKRVALKIVRDGVALTPQLRRRFEQEAKLVTAVGHPGVVDVHDIFEAPGGWPVLVMDVLSGETLGKWIANERRTLREIAGVLVEVVGVVVAAHRAGVVHRDLKPENIFICHGATERARVRVLDFGIARLLDASNPTAEPLTDTGTLLGTPQYMAPEQLFGERDVDERADVWALGVILFECLTGRRPISGDNVGQVVRNLGRHGVPKLDRSTFPDEIADCVNRMLEVDRIRRVRDLDAVQRTLGRASRGELDRGSAWKRLISFGRTSPAAASAFGSTVLCTGIALFGWANRASLEQPYSGERTSRPAPALGRAPPTSSPSFTIATSLPRTSLAGRVLDAWQRTLAKRTGGNFDVSVRWPGAGTVQGGERSLVSRLRSGQVDGALLSARALPSIAAAAGALELPGVVDSWSKVDWVRGHFRGALQSDFRAEGYRLLSWHDEGCRRIMSRGHPVRRVADLGRRRFATIETDPFSQTLFSTVPGSVAVPLAELDISGSLRDASRIGVSVVVGTAEEADRFGWTRALESVTRMPVACTSGAFLLREGAYDRLSDEVRGVVDDVSTRAEEAAAPRAREDDTTASLRLVRSLSPVDPSDADRREWQRFFVKSAALYTQRGVPAKLVDEAIALGREIDALE